jgi:hypothetical protein
VLDLSIRYPDSTRFWRFLSGAGAEPEVTAELHPVDTLGANPADWLEQRWRAKDAWLAERLVERS